MLVGDCFSFVVVNILSIKCFLESIFKKNVVSKLFIGIIYLLLGWLFIMFYV